MNLTSYSARNSVNHQVYGTMWILCCRYRGWTLDLAATPICSVPPDW